MSALPPIADIDRWRRNVRFVPEADIAPAAHSNKAAGNAGAQRTRGDIAFAEMTGRCVASAMAMLLGHPGVAPVIQSTLKKAGGALCAAREPYASTSS
jgi:hypothetical protein